MAHRLHPRPRRPPLPPPLPRGRLLLDPRLPVGVIAHLVATAPATLIRTKEAIGTPSSSTLVLSRDVPVGGFDGVA